MQRRSSIRWIGERSSKDYAIIPNSLARCSDLTAPARSVALYLWSQPHGYEISERSIAKSLKMNRKAVARALDNLIEYRWLIKVRHETRGGGAWWEYLARRCGPFRGPPKKTKYSEGFDYTSDGVVGSTKYASNDDLWTTSSGVRLSEL